MEKDPYYTYTNYIPARRSRSFGPVLLAAGLVLLGLVVYLGAIWYL